MYTMTPHKLKKNMDYIPYIFLLLANILIKHNCGRNVR